MDNKLTTPEDFLMDDSFLEYCMGANQSLNKAWDLWISKNPAKKESIDKAKKMFAMIHGHDGNVEADLSKFRSLLQERQSNEVVNAEYPVPPVRTMNTRMIWRVAAAVLLLAAVASLTWYLTRPSSQSSLPGNTLAQTKTNDLPPGGSRAKLTMGDGRSVDLDSLNAARLNEKDGTVIDKGNGILVYDHSANTSEEVLFNTLSTPRGGEYQLVLPDGSKVWLNAASSLRYPTRFNGKDRTVYLTGEAYFEVTKNPGQPFHVEMSNGQQVEVLGTQFNVMSYEDENVIKTTLVEGKVKVKQANDVVYLKPSQQSIYGKSNLKLSVAEADVDKEIGWKLGYFEFEDEDLPTIMRQLARWYDMDVVYLDLVPDKHYAGSISKKLSLMKVLEILKLAGVEYTIEGKRMTIKRV